MNYRLIYNNLISKAQSRQQFCSKSKLKKQLKSIEVHHITPRSMNGTNDKTNLVILSAREHFLAHWLLRNIHRNSQMSRAFLLMCTVRNNRINSRTFQILKEEQIRDITVYSFE